MVPISVPGAPGAQWHAYMLREPVGVRGDRALELPVATATPGST